MVRYAQSPTATIISTFSRAEVSLFVASFHYHFLLTVDDTLKLWDLRNLKLPVHTRSNLNTFYQM